MSDEFKLSTIQNFHTPINGVSGLQDEVRKNINLGLSRTITLETKSNFAGDNTPVVTKPVITVQTFPDTNLNLFEFRSGKNDRDAFNLFIDETEKVRTENDYFEYLLSFTNLLYTTYRQVYKEYGTDFSVVKKTIRLLYKGLVIAEANFY